MTVSRCPHCQVLLLPYELLEPTCARCGGPIAAAGGESPAPIVGDSRSESPAPAERPPHRSPWLPWAAVVLLALTNAATLAWILWHNSTARPAAAAPPTALVDVVRPPETTPPSRPDKPVIDSPKNELPKPPTPPADKPAPLPEEPPKPPAPMPPPVVPPVVVLAPPPPPVILPDLTNIEGMQGRVDCNAAGDVIALRLGKSSLDDNDLILLQPFDHLRDLNLDQTSVTDRGLALLQRLRELRKLDLSRTQITDAGLGYLKALTQLNEINLVGTKVTDAGAAELRTALPDLKISR